MNSDLPDARRDELAHGGIAYRRFATENVDAGCPREAEKGSAL